MLASLDELTPSKRRVLELAEGLSNVGIADRLVLSNRTVENYVRFIFMKLGLLPGARREPSRASSAAVPSGARGPRVMAAISQPDARPIHQRRTRCFMSRFKTCARAARSVAGLCALAAIAVSAAPAHAVSYSQRTLPFSGLDSPFGVAVDAAGNVLVADHIHHRVVTLPAGGGAQVTLPFTGLFYPSGVAIDAAGNVFVTNLNNRVVELPAGGGAQVTLPFSGLSDPVAVTVDAAGTVFVADRENDRVVALPAGGGVQVTLPFSGLSDPVAMAVDAAGTVFVADRNPNRVVALPAGGGAQVTLPFSGLSLPEGLAVDAEGNVFVADRDRVIELPAGGSQVTLPFSGLSHPFGVAVDAAGTVFVADAGDNARTVELLTVAAVRFARDLAGRRTRRLVDRGDVGDALPARVVIRLVGGEALASLICRREPGQRHRGAQRGG